MIVRHYQNNSLKRLGLLLIFLLTLPSLAAVSPDSDPVSGTDRLEISKTVQQGVSPDPGFNPPVEKILSELSDDQVRRLLIEALRQQPRQTAASPAEEKKLGGLASLIKKIRQNEELAPKLLEAIKSQGVREMDDSAMIMRIKYKTRPGEQFAVRKEVYRLMQEAFKEEGIEFAHRNVTVYLPREATKTDSVNTDDQNAQLSDTDTKKMMDAGGAAAAAAIAQAEEAEKKPKSK